MSGLSLVLSPGPYNPLTYFPTTLATRYSTTPFTAYATLISDETLKRGMSAEEILRRVKEGVAQWKAKEGRTEMGLMVAYDELQKGTQLYQSVFVSLCPSAALLSLHEIVLSSLSLAVPSPPTYLPHLSLVYGDLTEGRKEEIMDDLRKRGEVAEGKAKAEGEGKVDVLGAGRFLAREIKLVKPGAAVGTWEVLGKVDL